VSLRVLLADDSVIAQTMGKNILGAAGYDVVTVSNGLAAAKKIADLHPDIVVLDVYMPGYTGIEVCEKTKLDAATAQIPILLTVGKMEPFRSEEAIKVKADGLIIKPFEIQVLLTVVGRLAQRVHPLQPALSPRVGHQHGEICDVCGYVNREHAFACQQCDVPLRSSIS
jgi:two-component system, OmpR family, KDP operon response regulator KdpE